MGSARINAKEREKKERRVRRANKRKGIDAERVKPSTSSREIYALLGGKEQNGKQNKKKKVRNRERVPNLVTPDH